MAGSNKNSTFIIIEDAMVSQMGLSGNRLVIYALISGFCKKYGCCVATMDGIAERVGISKRQVIDNMNWMVSNGYLTKEPAKADGSKFYLSDGWKKGEESSPIRGEETSSVRGEESSPQGVRKVHQGGEESSPQGVRKVHPISNIISKEKVKEKVNKRGNSSELPAEKGEISSENFAEKNEVVEEVEIIAEAIEENQPAEERKKSSAKRKKYSEAETWLHGQCRSAWEQVYAEAKGENYYWQAKDGGAVVGILKQIKFHTPESQREDVETLLTNFTAMVRAIMSRADEWTKRNVSLTLINSKFNELYTQLKNNTTDGNRINNDTATGRKHVNARDDDEFIASLFAELHASQNQ